MTKADQVVANGPSYCVDCHLFTTTWDQRHTGVSSVDHTTRVDEIDGTTCASCHDATAGGTNGLIPVDGTSGNKVHDACYDCHDSTVGVNLGQLQNITATGGSAPIARGDCGTCHSATYFDSHTHHTTANNQLAYDVATDRSQETNDPSKACAECHHDAPPQDNTTFGTLVSPDFDAIRYEHDVRDGSQDASGGCETCQDYASDSSVGDDTPVLATVNTVIGTDATAICTSCHVPKLWSSGASSTHGGHAATDFSWSASCGTADCHDSANNTDIISDIHGSTGTITSPLYNERSNGCENCHDSSAGGDNTTIGANGVNGYVGDAKLASPDNHTEQCTD